MPNPKFTVHAEQFVGQDIAGLHREFVGVDQNGGLEYRVRVVCPGGQAYAKQGDWIVTFGSGQQVIITAETWEQAE